jgi:molybdenum cofactor guanylyltransferase
VRCHRTLAIRASRVFGWHVEISPPPPFSAVLLAGGKSSRMGREKAGLIVDDQPLWQRQFATLRATQPAELFISGKPDGPYVEAGVPIVVDAQPGLGPLGGLATALHHAQHEHLLVLAIDLPAMTAAFLTALQRTAAAAGKGVVPQGDKWFEPLAAVYPRSCLPLVEQCLRGDDHSMQHFVRLAVQRGHLSVFPLTKEDDPHFRNLNEPSDCGSTER